MKKPRRRRGFGRVRETWLFFAGPAVGADFGWVDAGAFEHAISGLVSQESKPSFRRWCAACTFRARWKNRRIPRDASGLRHALELLDDTRREIRSISDLLLEKLRYLQLNIMGGQAERIWTSLAPEP